MVFETDNTIFEKILKILENYSLMPSIEKNFNTQENKNLKLIETKDVMISFDSKTKEITVIFNLNCRADFSASLVNDLNKIKSIKKIIVGQCFYFDDDQNKYLTGIEANDKYFKDLKNVAISNDSQEDVLLSMFEKEKPDKNTTFH